MPFAELATLIVSTAILAKSASLVVESASKLSNLFRVSQLAVGLLLISVSTSLPELSVSVVSAGANEGAIAAGNVFGSNIANILLILGIAAFAFGFKVPKQTLPDLALVLLFTTLISIYILYHSLVEGSALSFAEGAVLLLIGAWYAFRLISRKRINDGASEACISMREGFRAFLLFFAGVVLVLVSSSFVVESAVKLADMLGLAKSFIGATLIAVGTSLPELSVDLQAFRKKQYGLALGDAIGSNMANLTLVLGSAAAINPIVLANLKVFTAALLFAVVANSVFFYIAVVRGKFEKKDGGTMLLLYLAYLVLIFFLQFG